jgi:SPP1 gp7 family putative phage head morphogenesis protein
MKNNKSLNDRIANSVTYHAIDLLRYEKAIELQIRKHLIQIEKRLVELLSKIDPTSPTISAYRYKRMEKLFGQVRASLRSEYSSMSTHLNTEMKTFAALEGKWMVNVLNSAIGIDVLTVALTSEQLKAITSNILIQGAPSKVWWSRQATGLQNKFEDVIRQGMVGELSLSKMLRRVRGRRENQFKDGLMNIPTHQAELLIRSSIHTVSNAALTSLYENNPDVVKGVAWLSTLDMRTTSQCRVRDGLVYNLKHTPIGHSYTWEQGPGAIHWGCRSAQTPIVKKFSSLRKQEQDKIKSKQTRASMDGQVPKSTNYEQWLKGKPPDTQNKILGKQKADLWRKGKVNFKQLTDQTGNPLTLEQLAQKI